MYYISYIIYYHVKKENIKKCFNVKVNDYVYLIIIEKKKKTKKNEHQNNNKKNKK